jgi:hypothetical protein
MNLQAARAQQKEEELKRFKRRQDLKHRLFASGALSNTTAMNTDRERGNRTIKKILLGEPLRLPSIGGSGPIALVSP